MRLHDPSPFLTVPNHLHCIFLAFRFSFVLSIHVFGCLPLFLLPLMLQCSTLVGNLFASTVFTCPNHSVFLSGFCECGCVIVCTCPSLTGLLQTKLHLSASWKIDTRRTAMTWKSVTSKDALYFCCTTC